VTAPFVGYGRERGFDEFRRVVAGKEKAKAGGFFAHGGVEDGLGIDSSGAKGMRESRGLERAACNGGNDGDALGEAGVEAEGLGFSEKKRRDALEAFHALRLVEQNLQGGQGGGGEGWRHSHAVNETGRGEFEVVHQGATASDVAATGGQRFAERSHPDVHFGSVDAKMFAESEPARAHGAEGMGLVDHEKSGVAVFDFEKFREVREVAVHAVEALDDDADPLVVASAAMKNLVERFPIVVRKRKALGAAELGALDGAVVDEGIVQDEVARSEEITQRRDSGGMAADHHHGIFGAVNVRQSLLQLAVEGAFPRNDAAGGDGGPEFFYGGKRCGIHGGMTAEAEVVVAGEVDELAAVHQGGGGGDAFHLLEEWAGHADFFGSLADEFVALVAGVLLEIGPLASGVGCRRGNCKLGLEAAGLAFEGFENESLPDLGGQSAIG